MKKKFTFLVFIIFFIITPAFAERLAVISSIANIRSGPGTKYDVVWQIEKYHPLNTIKKEKNWYQFSDFEGDKGWINKSLTKKIKTVITKKDKCNIRSGPGTKYKIILKADKGIPFKVIKNKGHWLQIMHSDGDKGWIYKKLVW